MNYKYLQKYLQSLYIPIVLILRTNPSPPRDSQQSGAPSRRRCAKATATASEGASTGGASVLAGLGQEGATDPTEKTSIRNYESSYELSYELS